MSKHAPTIFLAVLTLCLVLGGAGLFLTQMKQVPVVSDDIAAERTSIAPQDTTAQSLTAVELPSVEEKKQGSAPVKPAPDPVPESNISFGPIPPGTFTNNSFLEDNTFVTQKGTQMLRPPKGWNSAIIMDSSFATAKNTSGLTIVNFYDPKGGGNVLMSIMVSSKSDGYSLASEKQKMIAKSETISQSDITFFGRPGFLLVQKATTQGIDLRMKALIIEGNTKIYTLIGASLESDWDKYDSLYTSSFATFQIHD